MTCINRIVVEACLYAARRQEADLPTQGGARMDTARIEREPARQHTTMMAIVQDRYGAPDDVLGLQEIDQPALKDGYVLVAHSLSRKHRQDAPRRLGTMPRPRRRRAGTG
jgi:hypothetical protein